MVLDMSEFQTLVINLATRKDRHAAMKLRLSDLEIEHIFVKAVKISDLSSASELLITPTAEAVWMSHLNCLRIATSSTVPVLIFEDDAVPKLNKQNISDLARIMLQEDLDFIQIGFLTHNFPEAFSIHLRNFYNTFTRNRRFSFLFQKFGFKEVARASAQIWRSRLPNDFVVNDLRYGAHCYLVNPKFANRVIRTNNPPFLAADDFYVALSKMKTFKMVRLKKSKCSQDESVSSFTKRYLLD